MKRQLAVAAITVTALTISGCQQAVLEGPSLRQVSYGFEDLVDRNRDWTAESVRLDAVGANAVSIGVGRPEWAAFPSERPGSTAPESIARGDLVSPALAMLGAGREVTLVVDAFMPLTLDRHPRLAGVHADGTASEDIGSVSALDGELGDRVVAFASEVAERYRPDFVGITELLVDGATFGEADLAHYRAATGARDWPRQADGTIAVDDPSIADWVSAVVADLVARVADAVHEHGVRLAMDVRVARDDAARGRPASGHDYALLAAVADRLVLWNFFDSGGVSATSGSELTANLSAAGFDPNRMLVQVGLWGPDDTTLDASTLETALRYSATNGFTQVSVTPASLLTDAHWDAIARAWSTAP